MSLEPCLKLIATDGRRAKVKRQWVPDNWSCDEEAPPSEPSCSGSCSQYLECIVYIQLAVLAYESFGGDR